MRSLGVIVLYKVIDQGAEFMDLLEHISYGVEFVSPAGLHAFDPSVQFGRPGRQDPQVDLVFLTGGFELGHEFGTAVDLDGFDRERRSTDKLVEEAGSRSGRGVGRGQGGCPSGLCGVSQADNLVV